MRRPSPAMLVALVALVLATGLPAEAARKISGKLIKANTLPGTALKDRTIVGKKVANDTLGGTQVNESLLGKVPFAAQSDNAANADNATNAGFAQNAAAAQTATLAANATHADAATLAADTSNLLGAPAADVNRAVFDPSAGSCDPDDFDIIFLGTVCDTVGYSQPAVGKVLVLALGNYTAVAGGGGTCAVEVGIDGQGAASPFVHIGDNFTSHDATEPGQFTIMYVFDDAVVPVGTANFSTWCYEDNDAPGDSNDPDIAFSNIRMIAVRLSDT